VKGRKQGVSTYTAASVSSIKLCLILISVFIFLSHHSDSTKVLFGIVSTFFNNLPEQLKVKLITDNSKEIEFDNHSNYTVATAGSGEIGRGATPHFLHCSEVASYENEDALGDRNIQGNCVGRWYGNVSRVDSERNWESISSICHQGH
jgi:hypothetical protein